MKKFKTIVYGKHSFQKNDVFYVNEVDLEIPHGEDYKIALDELQKIKDLSINKLDFLSQFRYGNNSMWWFIFPNIVPVYKKIINFIISFQNLIDEIRPEYVKIEGDFEKLYLIKQICAKNIICLNYSKLKYSKFVMKQKLIKNLQESRFYRITNRKIKHRKKLFSKNEYTSMSLKNKIIFAIPTLYRRKIFDYELRKSKSGEYILESIMHLIKNEQIVGIDIDYTFKGDFAKSAERLHDQIPWFPIESFILNNKSKSIIQFLDRYKKIIKEKNFQELFVYREIQLWPNLEETFRKMTFLPNLPLFLNLIESLSELFKNDSPKAIFLPYETGPYALSIIIACENLGIKTIGVSHAFIANNFPMYSHYCCKSKNNSYGHPIPDTTLVFGEFAKKILVDAGYPPEKVVPFGNPAFFNLEKLQETLSKVQPRKKYKIANNRTIILFTSGKLQPKYHAHGNYDYDIQIWNQLINKFGNDDNFFLILKPHPQEADTLVYQKIVEQSKVKNSLIIHGDLFELLFISNLVVSVYSTTMIDALCFQKPVIQVKFKNEIHPIPFEKYGTILTSQIHNLSSKIELCLSKKNIQNDLIKNRKKFLKDQYGIPESNPEETLKNLIN